MVAQEHYGGARLARFVLGISEMTKKVEMRINNKNSHQKHEKHEGGGKRAERSLMEPF